jgi:hypothetical protein
MKISFSDFVLVILCTQRYLIFYSIVYNVLLFLRQVHGDALKVWIPMLSSINLNLWIIF